MLNRRIFAAIRRKIPTRRRHAYDVFFVLFSLSGMAFLSLLAPVFYALRRDAIGSAALLLALGMGLNLVLWRLGMSGFWGQTNFEAMIIAAVAYCAWDTGGVASPFMVFLSITPLLPLYTTGKRHWVFFWLFAAFMTVASLLLMQLKGVIAVPVGNGPGDLMVYAVIYCALCLVQWLFISTQDQANRAVVRKIRGANQRLQKLSDELALANAHKDQFLATVSHELRTPLNAVIGYLSLTGSHDAAKDDLRQLVLQAQNSAAHLVTVINDLLDFSQIQKGGITLNPQDFNLHSMLQDTHAMLQLRASEHLLQYKLYIADSVPEWVNADQHRLRQMLINLLSNAVKFTRQGEVSLEAHFLPDRQGKDAGRVLLHVRDSGPGIAPSQLQRIFEPFVQLLREDRQTYGSDALRGNGLGLSITHRLAKSHGGTLEVQSVLGKGSTFSLSIPVHRAVTPSHEDGQAKPKDQHAYRILIVDDHEINRMVVRATLLRSLPHALIEEASDGVEGLAMIERQDYELVLADLLMPEMDGIEMARQVRRTLPTPRCDVFILALTAHIAPEAMQACKLAGINEVMAKPFDRHTLINRVLFYCETAWQAHQARARQQPLDFDAT